jgi:hypothetical protein
LGTAGAGLLAGIATKALGKAALVTSGVLLAERFSALEALGGWTDWKAMVPIYGTYRQYHRYQRACDA